ncbi:glutamine--fructose-6-phosphate transaminase (isomerizing), partial [Candidatus Woesearchaeota archaeon]|nr:glutamine--fructose-6-phosphate transaminase (isomerizing) [Candidatus Woesearchaeota archaeon]
ENLKKIIENKHMPRSTLGIAHTRWATHGPPITKNAHPHISHDQSVAIVHNGQITNFELHRTSLLNKKFTLTSDTDSEIFAHLIQEESTLPLDKAVSKVLTAIEGSYGLGVIRAGEQKIVGTRKGSTLYVGHSDHGLFLSSDTEGLQGLATSFTHLDDDEMVLLEKDCKTSIKNVRSNNEFCRKFEILELEELERSKKGYEYFMEKEIKEQPQTVANVLKGRIKDGKITLGGLKQRIDNIEGVKYPEIFNKTRRILVNACGTSFYAGKIGEHFFESLAGINTEADRASVAIAKPLLLEDNTIQINISQSGETTDTLKVLNYFKNKAREKKLKAMTVGIVNVVGSTIARETDCGIYLNAGTEKGVASTKAFTSQITALFLMALKLAELNNKATDNKIKKYISELEKIPDKIAEIMKQEQKIIALAEKYSKSKSFLYVGSGINEATAQEGALKLKEISYIPAEGYPTGELKHGAIALVQDAPIIALVCEQSHPDIYNTLKSNLSQVISKGGKVIAVATEGDKEVISSMYTTDVIFVPRTIEELTPLLYVVPLQLFAYHMARLLGRNVDKPRNLAKSVTVD